jgi:hypothetical protein
LPVHKGRRSTANRVAVGGPERSRLVVQYLTIADPGRAADGVVLHAAAIGFGEASLGRRQASTHPMA